MTEDYSDFVTTAKEMIGEFGREISAVLMTRGKPINTDKPWLGNTEDQEVSVKTNAVFVGAVGGYGQIISNDNLFQTSQQIALVAPPDTGEDLRKINQIIDDGEKWTVNVVKAVQPANDIILYYVGVSQ